MSNTRLPDYRLKQKLLYIDKTNPDILKKYGDLFMEEGALSDALDFYEKAGNAEALRGIMTLALESGDVMLFQQAAKALGLELKPADWEGIAQKAVGPKKYCFAMHALQKADSEEKLKALREIMEKEVD